METPNVAPEVIPGQIEEPKKSNTGMIIGIVVVVLLCCCCVIAIGGGWWLYANGDRLIPGASTLLNQVI
jgi:hypothetical protein